MFAAHKQLHFRDLAARKNQRTRNNQVMTAEKYLRQYKYACDRIRRCEREYRDEMLLIDAVRSLSDNDGMPHGSGISKPTEDKAVRLAERAERLVDAKLAAIRIRQEIFDTVHSLGGLEADVLIERYLYLSDDGNLRTWDEVCSSVNYSWYSVRLAWHRGLDKVEEILKSNKYIQE